jgi:hypothetical protein
MASLSICTSAVLRPTPTVRSGGHSTSSFHSEGLSAGHSQFRRASVSFHATVQNSLNRRYFGPRTTLQIHGWQLMWSNLTTLPKLNYSIFMKCLSCFVDCIVGQRFEWSMSGSGDNDAHWDSQSALQDTSRRRVAMGGHLECSCRWSEFVCPAAINPQP